MEDRQELVLENYDLEIKNQYRVRGAVLLDTKEGPRLLKEYEKLGEHFAFENQIKDTLARQEFIMTDQVVPTKEGEMAVSFEGEESYVVYQWYQGESCNYRKEADLKLAAQNLGKLHQGMKHLVEEAVVPEECLQEKLGRYNREMKRVYTFMKGKKRKSEFELCALSCFPEFYQKAKEVEQRLAKSIYYQKFAAGSRDVCHGEYNYHNLIYTKKGIATTNFEHAEVGIQLMDLAYFLRKVMEKNSWQKEMGKAILEGYQRYCQLGQEELTFLSLVLDYPMKYRKLLNHYMNGKKSWSSHKNLEKLIGVREQEAAKELFLAEIFD